MNRDSSPPFCLLPASTSGRRFGLPGSRAKAAGCNRDAHFNMLLNAFKRLRNEVIGLLLLSLLAMLSQ